MAVNVNEPEWFECKNKVSGPTFPNPAWYIKCLRQQTIWGLKHRAINKILVQATVFIHQCM